MKKTFILSFATIIAVLCSFSTPASGQTWGNTEELFHPVSHNLENGILVDTPRSSPIIENDYLFYTDFYGFHIYNIADPENPVNISCTPVPGKAYHFTIQDDIAYVCNDCGVVVIDIRDYANPEVVNFQHLDFEPFMIIVEQSYVYFAHESGVKIYKLTEDYGFELTGYIDIPPAVTNFAGFTKKGHFVYYVNSKAVFSLDVSDPEDIQLVSSDEFNTGGTCWGRVTIKDHYLMVATTLKLLVYDLSDPNNLTRVYEGLPSSHTIYNLVIENNIMVINHSNNGSFTICDITDPVNPTVIYAHIGNWFYNRLYTLGGLKNNILYILNNGQEHSEGYTVHLIDISEVTSPSIISKIESKPGKSRSVALLEKNDQRYALVARDNTRDTQSSSGLLNILNVTDPANPILLSTIDIPGHGMSIATDQNSWAYICVAVLNFPTYHYNMVLVNIEDLTNPYITDLQPAGGNLGYYFNSVVSYYDGSAYLIDKDYIRIYDGSSGTLIEKGITSVYGQNGMGILANKQGFVYVAGGNYGFQLYNVSNPLNPYMVNWHNTNGPVFDVSVEDGIACVADYSGSLYTFDVSQNVIIPSGQIYTNVGKPISVLKLNDIAYLGMDNGRIEMFDVSNPEQPESLGWYLTNGTRVNDMIADYENDLIYVANELETLILKLGNATTILPGDANCDGKVDISDVIVIISYIMGYSPEPFCFENADVNDDGEITISDVVITVNIIFNSK